MLEEELGCYVSLSLVQVVDTLLDYVTNVKFIK